MSVEEVLVFEKELKKCTVLKRIEVRQQRRTTRLEVIQLSKSVNLIDLVLEDSTIDPFESFYQS